MTTSGQCEIGELVRTRAEGSASDEAQSSERVASERDHQYRTCVGCRRRRPQSALVRCALDADGHADVSRTAAGRGAWLCRPPDDCFRLALRRRGFERAWRRPVDAATLAELAVQLGIDHLPGATR